MPTGRNSSSIQMFQMYSVPRDFTLDFHLLTYFNKKKEAISPIGSMEVSADLTHQFLSSLSLLPCAPASSTQTAIYWPPLIVQEVKK